MNYDDQINELVGMGFEEAISKVAITACKGNVQDAINLYPHK